MQPFGYITYWLVCFNTSLTYFDQMHCVDRLYFTYSVSDTVIDCLDIDALFVCIKSTAPVISLLQLGNLLKLLIRYETFCS